MNVQPWEFCYLLVEGCMDMRSEKTWKVAFHEDTIRAADQWTGKVKHKEKKNISKNNVSIQNVSLFGWYGVCFIIDVWFLFWFAAFRVDTSQLRAKTHVLLRGLVHPLQLSFLAPFNSHVVPFHLSRLVPFRLS